MTDSKPDEQAPSAEAMAAAGDIYLPDPELAWSDPLPIARIIDRYFAPLRQRIVDQEVELERFKYDLANPEPF